MTQYVINIGAIPNDGTGDPLRTAFNETNLNFDQVFAAGPVLSNIQIANNKIITTNTNGNLILAPNGIGVIQANVSIVPNLANLRNLGSSTQRWATIYTQYLNVSTGTSINGDLSVAGNLIVQGNIIPVGNIVTDSLTIQLANTATTANAANGAGITVGLNDDIATLLYNSASNVWAMNIGLATPNIVVNNISSDDSTFVSVQDGLDVQGDITAETLSVAGNITGNYFIGNGSQLTGIASSYGNANVATFLAAFGSNIISTTGNITTTANISGVYILGDGSQLTGLPASYANANAVSYGESGWAGNIIPSGNAVYSLGNATNQWNDLYVSNATIFMNNVPISLTAGNVLTVDGNAVLTNGSNTAVSTTGNITAGNIGITGGSLTWANASIVQTSASDVSITGDGQVTVRSLDGTYQWTFDSNGTLTLPGATAGETIATQSGYITVGNLLIGQGGSLFNSNNDSWALYGNLSDPGATILIPSNADAGNGTALYIESQQSNVEIRSGSSTWNFDSTGNLTVPGNIIMTTGIVGSGASPAPSLSGFSSVSAVTVSASGNISATGNVTSGNISTGVITLTNGATIRDTSGDAVAFGQNAGLTSQGNFAVGIGRNAGQTTQGGAAVAIGVSAGDTSQGNSAVAVGQSAGFTNQSANTVAVGVGAGQTSQGVDAVAVGASAGSLTQGIAAVAIGTLAGRTFQANNSIIINATGANLDQTTANTFTVAPIRNDVANVAEILFYNTTSKEITYGNVISVTGNITGGNILTGGLISATGNITGNYILGNGSQLTSINAVTVDITDTNGLTTVYYPTFVENRTTGQIARADVDLTYRTDDNLLTVGNVSVTGNITGNTAGFAIGYRDIPQVSFTGNATIATTDAGKHFYSTQSTDYILTIANNASQGFQVGAAITVVNQGTGNITVAQGSGVTLYLAGNATSGNRTVATFGMATIMKVATDTWFINGTGVS